MKKTHLIIGASAAGIAAAQKLRMLDATSDIICISDEVELPYNKCHLADFVAGIKAEQQLSTLTAENAHKKNITLMLATRVTTIVPAQKIVLLADGKTLSYDTLLIATGSRAIMPPIDGITKKGVFPFHSLHDIHALNQWIAAQGVRHVVVIGGGLTGLESADACAARGLTVTVVEQQSQVLSAFITPDAAAYIHEQIVRSGAQLVLNQRVAAIEGTNRVTAVRLADGSQIPADLVIVAAGVRGNSELALSAGIACTPEGIEISPFMQTSQAHIFAAGDVCVVKDLLTGALVPSRTWPDAMFQGMMAAHAMAGDPRPYPGMSVVISSHFFDIKFASCGPVLNPPADCITTVRSGNDFYHQYAMNNGYLKGFLLVGDTGRLAKLRQALMQQAQVDINALYQE